MGIPVISLKLEPIFESIRYNNRFTLSDTGAVEWLSDWQDDEIQPFDKVRVSWTDGEGRLEQQDDDSWSLIVVKGTYTDEDIQFLYPFYEYGAIPEIVAAVNGEFGVNKNTAFPLAALVTIDNPYSIDDSSDYVTYSMYMYLCVKTSLDTTVRDRYIESYEDMLHPLWVVIRRYLEYNSIILTDEKLTNRERWGSNGLYGRENNVFNEMVDALEINITLTFNIYNNGKLCNT